MENFRRRFPDIFRHLLPKNSCKMIRHNRIEEEVPKKVQVLPIRFFDSLCMKRRPVPPKFHGNTSGGLWKYSAIGFITTRLQGDMCRHIEVRASLRRSLDICTCQSRYSGLSIQWIALFNVHFPCPVLLA